MSDEKELTQEELEKAAGGLRTTKTNQTLQNAEGEANEAPDVRSGSVSGSTNIGQPTFGTGQ